MFNGKGKAQAQVDAELFTIYDSKTDSYGDVLAAVNGHDLVRQITNMFTDPAQSKNRLYLNAEDYSMFKIGVYDKKTGAITSQEPQHVANLHELRTLAKRQTEGIIPT